MCQGHDPQTLELKSTEACQKVMELFSSNGFNGFISEYNYLLIMMAVAHCSMAVYPVTVGTAASARAQFIYVCKIRLCMPSVAELVEAGIYLALPEQGGVDPCQRRHTKLQVERALFPLLVN